MADAQYGFYTAMRGFPESNKAYPTPSQLRKPWLGLDLRTQVFVGARADQQGDRHFHGTVAGLAVMAGAASALFGTHSLVFVVFCF